MSTIDDGADAAELPWERFWQLIDLLGGEAAGTSCAGFASGCERLGAALAAGSVTEIVGFGERLAEALYRLDREEYGTQRCPDPDEPDGEPLPLTDDGFLYARAAAVAAGRAGYESVLADPDRFAPYAAQWGEELLYVHEEAYEEVTGEEWDIDTRYDFESCANREGWPSLAH
ncbi:DUF4240 domain-containing protein [Kitasatospora sp. NPDC093806]|uniref:DUF4240 domain-containing protein n=1 Tax=Kitasatospora sp. NPDC093806 TaxID=3155075 RepID=UPI00341BA567